MARTFAPLPIPVNDALNFIDVDASHLSHSHEDVLAITLHVGDFNVKR